MLLKQQNLSPGGRQTEFSARDLLALSQQDSPSDSQLIKLQKIDINSQLNEISQCDFSLVQQDKQQHLENHLTTDISTQPKIKINEFSNSKLTVKMPMKHLSTQECSKQYNHYYLPQQTQSFQQIKIKDSYQLLDENDIEDNIAQNNKYRLKGGCQPYIKKYAQQDLLEILANDSTFQQNQLIVACNEEDDMSKTEFKFNMQSKDSGFTATQNNLRQSLDNCSGFLQMQTFIDEKKLSHILSKDQSQIFISSNTNTNKSSIECKQECFEYATQNQKQSAQQIMHTENTAEFATLTNHDGQVRTSKLLSPNSLITQIKMNQLQSKRNCGDVNDLISMDEIDSQQTLHSKEQSALHSMVESQKDLTLRITNNKSNNRYINVNSNAISQKELINALPKVQYLMNQQIKQNTKDISEVQQEYSLSHPNPQSYQNIQEQLQQLDFKDEVQDQQNQSLLDFQNLERQQLKEEYKKLKKQLQEMSRKNKEQSSLNRNQQKAVTSINLNTNEKNSSRQQRQNNNQNNGLIQQKSIETTKDISTLESVHRSKDRLNSYNQDKFSDKTQKLDQCDKNLRKINQCYDNQLPNKSQNQEQRFFDKSLANSQQSQKLRNKQKQSPSKHNNIIKKDRKNNSPKYEQALQSSKLTDKLYQIKSKTRNQHYSKHDNMSKTSGKLSTLEYPHMYQLIQNVKRESCLKSQQQQHQMSYQSLSQSARTSIANLRTEHIIKSQKHKSHKCDNKSKDRCSSSQYHKSQQSKERKLRNHHENQHRHTEDKYQIEFVKKKNRTKQCSKERQQQKSQKSRINKENNRDIMKTIVIQKADNSRFNEFMRHRGSVTPQDKSQVQKQLTKNLNNNSNCSRRQRVLKVSPQENLIYRFNEESNSKQSISLQRQSKDKQLQRMSYDDNRYGNSQQRIKKSLGEVPYKLQFTQQQTKKQRSISQKQGFSFTQKKYKEDDQSSMDSNRNFIVVNNRYKEQEQSDSSQNIKLSPSKLNQELNKILETERMIKEYKEVITKMQRDIYSKKTTVNEQNNNEKLAELSKKLKSQKKSQQSTEPKKTPTAILNKRRIFQEDINLKEAIQPLINKADIDTLRVQQIKQLENAIEQIKIKIESSQPSQESHQQPDIIIEQQTPFINRESLLSYPSTIRPDLNLKSDFKMSRICISPEKQQQSYKISPNTHFAKKNNSNSKNIQNSNFTSFPLTSKSIQQKNQSTKKTKFQNSIEKSRRLLSNENIPPIYIDNTVIPEEDYQEQQLCNNNQRPNNFNFEDESIINYAQQQQDILNFYKEYRQDDDTIIPTPMSIMSKQQSFINQSPMILKPRRISDQNSMVKHKQKLNHQLNQLHCQQSMSQIKKTRQSLSAKKVQPEILSKYANQDIKVVKIQINKQKKLADQTSAKFQEVMKITSGMLNNSINNNKLSQQFSSSKTRIYDNKTPQRTRVSSNFQNTQIVSQSINNIKSLHNTSLNRSNHTFTQKYPLSSLQTQRITIDIKRPQTTLSSTQQLPKETQSSYQNVVSQILYKKSSQKGTINSNLSKFMEDSQKRLQKTQVIQQKLLTNEQSDTLSQQFYQTQDLRQPQNLIADNDYMTFNSTQFDQNLVQGFNNYQNEFNYTNNSQKSTTFSNTQTCSLRNSLQIKPSTTHDSGVKRQQWGSNNNQTQKSNININSNINKLRQNQTRNSVTQQSFQPLVQNATNCSSQNYSTLNSTGIFNNKKSISNISNNPIHSTFNNQIQSGIINSSRMSISQQNTHNNILSNTANSSRNNSNHKNNNVNNTGRNSAQFQQNSMYSSIPVTKLNLKM